MVATATAHNAVSLELTHTATRRYFAFPAARPASMSTNACAAALLLVLAHTTSAATAADGGSSTPLALRPTTVVVVVGDDLAGGGGRRRVQSCSEMQGRVPDTVEGCNALSNCDIEGDKCECTCMSYEPSGGGGGGGSSGLNIVSVFSVILSVLFVLRVLVFVIKCLDSCSGSSGGGNSARQQRLLAAPQPQQMTYMYAQQQPQPQRTSYSNPASSARSYTPASLPESLPLGWEERPHPSGRSQYYNIRTKELTWIKPTATAPAPTTSTPAAAARATGAATDLAAALKGAHLLQYEDALRELGCVDAADLVEVDEQDLLELGMKKIEVTRQHSRD